MDAGWGSTGICVDWKTLEGYYQFPLVKEEHIETMRVGKPGSSGLRCGMSSPGMKGTGTRISRPRSCTGQ